VIDVTLETDWFGRPIAAPPSLSVERDDGALVFTASRESSPPRHPSASAGAFVEGLWEYEVAELFLADATGYLELNLAPCGAFWAQRFDAPRVRSERQPDPAVFLATAAPGWSASLRIPDTLVPTDLRFNLTFVTAAREHLSLAELPGPRPDFHQPSAFLDAPTSDT